MKNQKGVTVIDLLITVVVVIILYVCASLFFKVHDNYQELINERIIEQEVIFEGANQ